MKNYVVTQHNRYGTEYLVSHSILVLKKGVRVHFGTWSFDKSEAKKMSYRQALTVSKSRDKFKITKFENGEG
jgi:hypothetical protein